MECGWRRSHLVVDVVRKRPLSVDYAHPRSPTSTHGSTSEESSTQSYSVNPPHFEQGGGLATCSSQTALAPIPRLARDGNHRRPHQARPSNTSGCDSAPTLSPTEPPPPHRRSSVTECSLVESFARAPSALAMEHLTGSDRSFDEA